MKTHKKSRNMKVYAQSGGYDRRDTATIILKGLWLENYGFQAGTQIKVECEEGRLIITKRENVI